MFLQETILGRAVALDFRSWSYLEPGAFMERSALCPVMETSWLPLSVYENSLIGFLEVTKTRLDTASAEPDHTRTQISTFHLNGEEPKSVALKAPGPQCPVTAP